MLRDLQLTLRGLRRSPGFALAAVGTLAVGLAFPAVVLSLVNVIFIRPLPYPDSETLFAPAYQFADGSRLAGGMPSPVLDAWMQQSRAVQAWGQYSSGTLVMSYPNGEQLETVAYWVTPGVFQVLKVAAPTLGRYVNSGDAAALQSVAVLSYAFWTTRFASDQHMVGKSIVLGGRRYDVIGVAAADLRFPALPPPDVYLPMAPVRPDAIRTVQVLGRLRDGRALSDAVREAHEMDRRSQSSYPSPMSQMIMAGGRPTAVSLRTALLGARSTVVVAAGTAAGLVLLLACSNVGALMMVRNTSRMGDFAVMMALGATPASIARLAALEALSLSFVGAAVAVAVLGLTSGTLERFLSGVSPLGEAGLVDWRVVMLMTPVVFGAALSAAVIPGVQIFFDAKNAVVGRAIARRRAIGSRNGLHALTIGGQVTVACALVFVTLALLASLRTQTGPSLGFSGKHVLTFKVPAMSLASNGAAQSVALEELLEHLRRQPDVQQVGATTSLPLSGHAFGFVISVHGAPKPLRGTPETAVDLASTGYFDALSIAIRSGRTFSNSDTSSSQPVAIVNESFVDAHLKGRDPFQSRMGLGGDPETADISIVGIAQNVQDGIPGQPIRPRVYRPFTQAAPQMGWHTAAVAVKTAVGRSYEVANSLPMTIRSLFGGVSVYDYRPMAERLGKVFVSQVQQLSALFVGSLMAIALAAIGLYAFLSYSVAGSTTELAVRAALGAGRSNLLRLALWRGVVPAAFGVVAGLALGNAVLLALRSAFGDVVSARTEPNLASAGVIVLVMILASYLPARRALRINPAWILRR